MGIKNLDQCMEVSFLINTYYVILLPGLGGPEGREVGNGDCEQHAENRKGTGPDRAQSRACGVSWAGKATTPLQGFVERHQPKGYCDRAHPIAVPLWLLLFLPQEPGGL